MLTILETIRVNNLLDKIWLRKQKLLVRESMIERYGEDNFISADWIINLLYEKADKIVRNSRAVRMFWLP